MGYVGIYLEYYNLYLEYRKLYFHSFMLRDIVPMQICHKHSFFFSISEVIYFVFIIQHINLTLDIDR